MTLSKATRDRLIFFLGVVAGIPVLIGLAYLISDKPGMPVPYDYNGAKCSKAGDLLSCPGGEGYRLIYVRADEAWVSPSSCRQITKTLERCRKPYLLEIDYGGDYWKLRRLTQSP